MRNLFLLVLVATIAATGCAVPQPSVAPSPLQPTSSPRDGDDAEGDDKADEVEKQKEVAPDQPTTEPVADDIVDSEPEAQPALQDEAADTLDKNAAESSPHLKPKATIDSSRVERSVAAEPATCDSPECHKRCGEYSGEKLTECAEALAKGCFEEQPPDDYDCGDYGGVRAKATLTGDP